MRKYFTAFLSMLLLLSMTLRASAVVATDANMETQQQVYNKIEEVLLSILPEKENYGLGDVDITELSIGQPIPSYEIVDNQLTQLDIMFYPIFDGNDKPVSMAATAMVNGDIIVSISTSFVKELQSVESNSPVSIVYDDDGPYLLTYNTMVKLADYPADMDFDRNDINTISITELQQVSRVSLSGAKPLTLAPQVQTHAGSNTSIYLDVPKVLQPTGSSICWAACVASTVSYKSFGPGYAAYTAEDVADLYGHHESLGCETVINKMNAIFTNMNYTNNGGNDDNFSNSWLSLNDNDSPVIGRFQYNSPGTGGHFLVIRGMSYYGTFSVMDPLETDATYRTGTITGTGNTRTFSILSYTGGSTLTLTHYGYEY